MTFTFDQAWAYFSHRLSEPKLPHREAITARCPFHNDRTASLSVHLGKGGIWKCHACNIGGGLFEFEKRMWEDRTPDECWDNIYKFTGAQRTSEGKFKKLGPVVATYRYTDADGRLLYEKRRHDPKDFTQRAPNGSGGWVYSLQGVPRVLYNLPQVITAKIVFICEGEKDADGLNAALGGSIAVKDGMVLPAIATCNFEGAGRSSDGKSKWREEYSAYLRGRWVVVLPDNDDPGREHAQAVARSVCKHAQTVKIVQLSGLPEKGDVFDYLQSRTKDDLWQEVLRSPVFREEKSVEVKTPFYAHAHEADPNGHLGVDWILPGVVHRGGKGMIIAQPKAGKSLAAMDMVVALAAGQQWAGIYPSQPVRSAFISREDSPGMTVTRVAQLAAGRGLQFTSMPWLHLNTFVQRSDFAIDNDEHLKDAIEATRNEGIEFVVVDVLNLVHSADENDNTKMRLVLNRFDTFRRESGADVALIHHDTHNAGPGARRPRGASSINGWWDWRFSLTVQPDDEMLKDVHFSSKAGMPHRPITLKYQQEGESGPVRIIALREEGR